MKNYPMTGEEFKNLRKLELHQSIYNSEAEMYIIDDETDKKVLKKFNFTEGPIFGNKLKTINYLMELGKKEKFNYLVLPEKIATIDNKVIGYIMKYINSINLKVLLSSPDIKPKYKIHILKEVGIVLDKMSTLRSCGLAKNFYLNDLHEGNFLLDKETNNIKVVDLDSCNIEDSTPFLSKYLSPFSPISEFPTKYKSCRGVDYCLASYYPDENSDIYCYIMMIINTIMGIEAYRLSKDDYFKYMEFLIEVGVSKELVDIFADVYSIKNNTNPKDLLDELIPQFDKLNLQNFNEFKRL